MEDEKKVLKREMNALKKAYKQMQENHKEEQQRNKQLLDELASKEKELRLTSDELDRLHFSNGVLTKRIKALQEEVECSSSGAPPGSFFGGIFGNGAAQGKKMEEDFAILSQELQVKIQENEKIHIEFFELKKKYDSETARTRHDLGNMKKYYSDLSAECGRKDNKLLKLMEEKESLIQERDNLKEECSHLLEQCKEKAAHFDINYSKLTKEIAFLKEKNQSNKLFDDSACLHDNNLNIPPFDKSHSRKRTTIGNKIVNIINQAVMSQIELTESEMLLLECRREQLNQFRKLVIGINEKRPDEQDELIVNLDDLITLLPQQTELLNDFFTNFMKNINSEFATFDQLNVSQDILPVLDAFLANSEQVLQLKKLFLTKSNLSYETNTHLTALQETCLNVNQIFSILKDFIVNRAMCPSSLLNNLSLVVVKLESSLSSLLQNEKDFISCEIKVPFIPLSLRSSGEKYIQIFSKFLSIINRLSRSLTEYQSFNESIFNVERGLNSSTTKISLSKFHGRTVKYLANLNNMSYYEEIPLNEAIDEISQLYSKKQSLEEKIKEMEENEKYLTELINHQEEQENILTKENKHLKQCNVTYQDECVFSQGKITKMKEEFDSLTAEKNEIQGKLDSFLYEISKKCVQEVSIQTDGLEVISPLPITHSIIQENYITMRDADNTNIEGETRENLFEKKEFSYSSPSLDSSSVLDNNTFLEHSFSNDSVNESKDFDNMKAMYTDVYKQYKSASNVVKSLKAERQQQKALMQNIKKVLMTSRMETDEIKRSYEDQIRILSEHSILLTEEIKEMEVIKEDILQCYVKCGECKEWNTIKWLIQEGDFGKRCSRGTHFSNFKRGTEEFKSFSKVDYDMLIN